MDYSFLWVQKVCEFGQITSPLYASIFSFVNEYHNGISLVELLRGLNEAVCFMGSAQCFEHSQ